MRQIIQNLKTGDTILEDVPAPVVGEGQLLIQTTRSLVSLGTEKMLVEFGKSGLLSKARQQPEKVKQVLDKIKSDGLLPTLEAVFNKLDEPLPLGYCNVGTVIEIGNGVKNFKIGDRVASNGQHAEIVAVPQNLVTIIPDNVTDEEATFTVIGSIGLQGIRLANPTLGETFVVIGLGLIGLITAELLIANGCIVIGFDFDDNKVELAKCKGVIAYNATHTDTVNLVESLTKNIGADGVIITASTKSNDVISQAARMSRKRGRIILVGVIGLEINRADFYKKELTFQVSCSYGPGRYDERYEQHGIDYPLSFVRWTEKRNFEAILQTISSGKLRVKDLITELVNLADFNKIYDNLGSGSIASILVYDRPLEISLLRSIPTSNQYPPSNAITGIIGAGNFTKMTLLPALKNANVSLKSICSAGGLTAKSLASKYKIAFAVSDAKEIFSDNEINLVIITTRHNLHYSMVIDALKSNKHVFVEKPLALSVQELTEIEKYFPLGKSLTVGYNRRFSPFSIKMKSLLGAISSPINIIATMNAGFIPMDVWIHDMKVGGGRIIGEACHFIDLMIYLTGSLVSEVIMCGLGTNPESNTDNAIITLKFINGSQGVIQYFSNGSKSYSKERIEVYSQNRTIILDNFRKMYGYGFGGFSAMSMRQNKGHENQFKKLINAIEKGQAPLIPFDELRNSALASIAAVESLQKKNWIKIE
jgi:predicted dehydrogenase/threonine dehydrogenase-like Zn-dependent dehydrogenase